MARTAVRATILCPGKNLRLLTPYIPPEMIQEIIEAMENYNKRGSNWVFKRVIRLDVNFVRWNPLRGSAWIPLPVKLANKKAVINMIVVRYKGF